MDRESQIRVAQAADLPGAIELLQQQFVEHSIDLGGDDLARALRVLAESPELGCVLVAILSGAGRSQTVVGLAALSYLWTLEHGGPAAWLDELYVTPERRGRGIGRRLVERAMDVARARGCVALDLEVEAGHEAVERLYERLGFRRHRRTRWARRLAGEPETSRATPLEPSSPGDFPARPSATTRARDRAREPTDDPRPFPSLDHLSLGVNDLVRAKAFYDAALAPLGLVPHLQIPGEVAYGPPDEPPEQGFAFYIGFEDPAAKRAVAASAGFHVALHAPSRQAVRDFHAAALAAGGRSYGEPGLRPRYHEHYYGAFVIDPDGHHIEAVCHAPEA